MPPLTTPQKSNAPTAAYIVLLALVMSTGAMGTDIMLPALSVIGEDLGVANPTEVHAIVTMFFLGMAIGQLMVGPLSDAYGRRPLIFAGYALFILGSLIAMTTDSWGMMMVARAMQGAGASAPKIVAVAVIRDQYEGRAMARIMSIVNAVFILVPIIAPAFGQGLIWLGGWRLTFVGLAVLSFSVAVWFALRLPETLAPENRRQFRPKKLMAGLREVARTRQTMGYTLAAGLINGAFIGYLGSAEMIFHNVFLVGDYFAALFALAALSIGLSSLANASLVMRMGMYGLSCWALVGLIALTFGFLLLLAQYAGVPPLWMFVIWQLASFFCVGILFANINSLAIEPLGHMAGLGAGFIGSISFFISLPIAAAIGNAFNGTVYPMVIGFAVLGVATYVTVLLTRLVSR